jgi:folate-binding protein YgfZ
MIVTLEDRSVLAIAGTDARDFLQGLLTNDMALLAPGHPLYAGLLSPQGKALFDMILHADEENILIDVAVGRAEALARRLSLYKLRKAVTIAPSPLRVLAAWNGDSDDHAADPRFAALGARWIGADTAALGAAVYARHRLTVGVPDSVDIGEDELLWLETGADLLNGVSFTKGCYVGQENTARMHHRDKVRRRLVPITIAGAPTDDMVRDDAGRSVGTLRSHAGELGFAHLRLEAAAGPLNVGGVPLTIGRPAWLAAALEAA